MRGRWARAGFTLTLALMLSSGCSRGGGPDDGVDRPPASSSTTARPVQPGERGPTAEGEFKLEGAVVLAGPYSVAYPIRTEDQATCGRIAAGSRAAYVVPVPTFSGDVRLSWTATVGSYRGPGTYGIRDLAGLGVDVRVTPDAPPNRFSAVETTTATATIKPDNSGTFEVSGLTDAAGKQLSGHLTWSCR